MEGAWRENGFTAAERVLHERVTREAVLNAVSHRNYQMSGSVFIRQYKDRLVVESPGGLPAGITLDNILDRQQPRNRKIAEILALCGVVERSGQGMNLMYELSIREAKALPDFTGTDNYFVSILLNGLVMDKNMLTVINRIWEERLEALSTTDFLIINEVYHEIQVPKHLKNGIKRLLDLGIIENAGRGKYVIARGLYAASGKAGIHTRIVGLDKETNKELILKHIRKNGEKGTQFREFEQVLPNLSKNQIKGLIKELRQEDRISVVGNTSSARWYIK